MCVYAEIIILFVLFCRITSFILWDHHSKLDAPSPRYISGAHALLMSLIIASLADYLRTTEPGNLGPESHRNVEPENHIEVENQRTIELLHGRGQVGAWGC